MNTFKIGDLVICMNLAYCRDYPELAYPSKVVAIQTHDKYLQIIHLRTNDDGVVSFFSREFQKYSDVGPDPILPEWF